jgi:mercuric ion transport protein
MPEPLFGPNTASTAGWRAAGLLGGLAAFAGGGAVFATSCCVVPLSLAALGATGAAAGAIETLAPYHGYLLGVSGLAVGSGWLAFLRQNRLSCTPDGACAQPRVRRRGAIALGIATLVAALAFVRPYIEPLIVGQWLGAA